MLTAKDIMTAKVFTVAPDDTVRNVATLLTNQGVSALPVVDGDELVGIVSEGDLLRREELGTGTRPRSWWLSIFTDSAETAADYTKAHARHVEAVMTKNVVTVDEDTSLADIADLLEKQRIKRVPVVREGKLIGIVSRANLIRALATARESQLAATAAGDGGIRDEILEKLRREPWASVGAWDVTVTDGTVAFWGRYRTEEEQEASRVLAENTTGVRSVEDHRIPIEVYYGAT